MSNKPPLKPVVKKTKKVTFQLVLLWIPLIIIFIPLIPVSYFIYQPLYELSTIIIEKMNKLNNKKDN